MLIHDFWALPFRCVDVFILNLYQQSLKNFFLLLILLPGNPYYFFFSFKPSYLPFGKMPTPLRIATLVEAALKTELILPSITSNGPD